MLRARDNPFATDRVLRERYRFSERDWAGLMRRLAIQGGRGALVGPKGSGKTTLLEDLGRRLTQAGRRVALIRLSEESPRMPGVFGQRFFAALGPVDAVLLDGAEQLAPLHWVHFRWRTRRAGLVVVTTHRGGRLPLLHRCETTPALLRDLVTSLGEELDDATACALHEQHRGNVREALRELYDRYAEKDAGALSFGALRA